MVIHVRLPSSLADIARQQAARLETTISDHIRQLSPSERADAHRIVEERRRLAILKAHDRDIDVLRAALGHVLQRLEAIESRLQKEVTSAAVA